MPMGTGDKACQQTAFQDALKQCYMDYASQSWSRRREHAQVPTLKASVPTPTQSPAQKSFKLKSTVTLVNKAPQPRSGSSSRNKARTEQTPIWHPTSRVPYHLIGVQAVAGQGDRESEEDLIKYMMNRFSWDHYSAELNDAGNAFGGKTTYVTRSCMAAALYFKVAWTRGEKWIFPVIPDLLTETILTRGGTLPEKPNSSRGRHAEDVKLRCREWWMYFLTLLQCWKDERSPFEYGGALRPDSKVLLFVYYRIKHIFGKAGITDFHLYQVKNATNWSTVMQKKYNSDQLRAMWKQHQEARDELTAFKQWMYTWYEAEAIREYDDLVVSNGDFDALANRRVDVARRPGNSEQFKKEMAAEQRRKNTQSGGLDAECQCQSESEE